jgi:hypothetical protein
MSDDLSPGQATFAILVGGGANEVDAWVRANLGVYSERKKNALLANPEVVTIIDRIRKEAENDAVMDLRERREFLARAVRTPADEVTPSSDLCQGFESTAFGQKVKLMDKLKCIDLDSKLAGDIGPRPGEDPGSTALSELIQAIRAVPPAHG